MPIRLAEADPFEGEAANQKVSSAASEERQPAACLAKQLFGDHNSWTASDP